MLLRSSYGPFHFVGSPEPDRTVNASLAQILCADSCGPACELERKAEVVRKAYRRYGR